MDRLNDETLLVIQIDRKCLKRSLPRDHTRLVEVSSTLGRRSLVHSENAASNVFRSHCAEGI